IGLCLFMLLGAGSACRQPEPLPNAMILAPPPSTAHYTVTIKPRWATLKASFRHPPLDPMPLVLTATQHADRIYDLQAQTDSGEPLIVTSTDTQGRWLVSGHQNRTINITYLVIDQRPSMTPSTPLAPLTTSQMFYGQGAALFLQPELPADIPRPESIQVRVMTTSSWNTWTSWGRDANTLQHLQELDRSLIIAGNWKVHTSNETNPLFQLATPHDWDVEPAKLSPLLTSVAQSHRLVFGSYPWNALLVVVAPTQGEPHSVTSRESITLLTPHTTKPDDPGLAQSLAHAHFALWTQQLPTPNGSDDSYVQGFIEGVNTWYALRTLILLNQLDQQAFMDQINGWFVAYYDLLLAEEEPSPEELSRMRALKSSVTAMSLDIELRAENLGTRSLDDLMRKLYLDFAHTSRPYTNTDIQERLTLISKGDWKGRLALVADPDHLLDAQSLDRAGIQVTIDIRQRYALGFQTADNSFDNASVTMVDEGSQAEEAGLKVGDIIQAIAHKPGDIDTAVHLVVRRDDVSKPLNLTFKPVREVEVPRITALGPLLWDWLGP
ncbi:MAG: hypothetical protein AAFX99_33100, partial [Myxococcota bacterium]